MASSASKTVSVYPIALEWTVAEARLKAMKNFIKGGHLDSETYTAVHSSGVKYSLRIHPNGNWGAGRGQSWFWVNLEIGNEKKVEAEYTVSIKSAMCE